jgi:hypothetical protein
MKPLTLIGVSCLALSLVIYGVKRYRKYREQRDLRIRYEAMSRFCIVPYRGTRPLNSTEDFK